MATSWPLTVEFDVPEPRVEKTRLIVSAEGPTLDRTRGSNCWVDPVTNTLMLAPIPTKPDWPSNYSGNYARLAKSSYTLPTPSAWVEVPRRGIGDIFLESNSGETAVTTASYPANQPMFVSIYVPGVESLSENPVLVCGWGTPGSATSVSLRVRGNGTVAVFLGSDLVGVYDVEGGLLPPGTVKKGPTALAGRTVDFLLLPMRRREIVVVCSAGSGFSHVRGDLDPLSTTNTITPAGPFWWYVPTSSGRASVQCAPCRFETTGTAFGRLVELRYTPASTSVWNGIVRSDRIGDASLSQSATVTVLDQLGNPVGPGNLVPTTSAQVKIDLTGTAGTNSIGIYSVDAYTGPTLTATADEPFDITCRLLSLSMSVPEFGATTLSLSARDPLGLAAAGLEKPDIIGDRPIRVKVGSVDIFRGTSAPPPRDYDVGPIVSAGDILSWEAVDREADMIDSRFLSAMPYDGLIGTDVIADLLLESGFDASAQLITADAFTLPPGGPVTAGQWELMPARGESRAQWIDRIWSDYFTTWIRGWCPTLSGYKYAFRSPASFSGGPHMTLWQSEEDAIAGGISRDLAMSRVVRSLTTIPIRAEANQVLVVGVDPQTGRAIYRQYDDAASQTPGTSPASRPDNWRGKLASVVREDPAITTGAAATRTRDILRDRLTNRRVMATWESDFLVRTSDDRPLWKGDVVRLYEFGRATYEDFRIVAIPRIDFEFEPASGTIRDTRLCEYAAERIGVGP